MTVKRNLFGTTTTTTSARGWNGSTEARRNKHSPTRMDISPVKEKMGKSPASRVSRTHAQVSLGSVAPGGVVRVKHRTYAGADSARALGRMLRAYKTRFGLHHPPNFATLELERPPKVDATQEVAEVAQALQVAAEFMSAGMCKKDMQRMLDLMSVGITRYMEAEVVGRCPNGNIQVIDLELEEADEGFQAILATEGRFETARSIFRSLDGYDATRYHRQINPRHVDAVLVDDLHLAVKK